MTVSVGATLVRPDDESGVACSSAPTRPCTRPSTPAATPSSCCRERPRRAARTASAAGAARGDGATAACGGTATAARRTARGAGSPSGGLRRDPLSGAWTVIATGREARPTTSAARAPRQAARGGGSPRPSCPFCEGHEQMTPPELDALRPDGSAPDTPGWTVRVVPNKYPVFEGGHEVVVHSPSHDRPLS